MKGVVLLVVLAGCGDSASDLAGLYQTTYRTTSSSCTEGPQMIDKPFFEIKTEMVLGFNLPVMHLCDSMDTATCTGLIEGLNLAGGAVSVAVQGSPCTLEYDTTALTAAGSQVSVRVERHRLDDPSLDMAHCTTDEAKARGASMPCVGLDVVGGTRVR